MSKLSNHPGNLTYELYYFAHCFVDYFNNIVNNASNINYKHIHIQKNLEIIINVSKPKFMLLCKCYIIFEIVNF